MIQASKELNVGPQHPLQAIWKHNTNNFHFKKDMNTNRVKFLFNGYFEQSLLSRSSANPLLQLTHFLLCVRWPQRTDKKKEAPDKRKALNKHNQVFTCCFRESCQDAGKHHVGRLGSIHSCMDPTSGVVVNQWGCLGMVGLQTSFQSYFIVI